MGRIASILMIAAAMLAGPMAIAQDVPAPGRAELQFTGGISQGFLDEPFPDFWLGGASLRLYISKRIALQPEFDYRKFRHPGYDDYIQNAYMTNMVLDLTTDRRRVVPYFIAGAGYLRERNGAGGRWSARDRFAAQGGFGLKIFVTKRFFVSSEVRAGRPLFQTTGGIGFVLNR